MEGITTYLIVVAVFCFAAFLQGLTGFGFGMAAMALLPLCMDFHEAVVLVAVLGLSVNLYTLFMYRHSFSWQDGRVLLIGAIVGTPCGVAVVEWVDESLLIRALGALICLFTANDLFVSRHKRISVPAAWAFPLGFLSGLFGAAFNIGGPPAVMYAYSRPWSKEQVVAVLQVLFLVIGVLRVGLSFGAGLVKLNDVTLALVTLLPMFVAISAGRYLLQRVSQPRLRYVVFIALLIVGGNYLIRG
ncbi:MAG: sulfite exporter TauE/SafE family protein [Pirellulales bacterium]